MFSKSDTVDEIFSGEGAPLLQKTSVYGQPNVCIW